MEGGEGEGGSVSSSAPTPFSSCFSGSEQIYKDDENVFSPPRILSFLGLLEKNFQYNKSESNVQYLSMLGSGNPIVQELRSFTSELQTWL
jgi:hypothetical protein